MAVQTLSTEMAASVVMDSVPPVMRFIRSEMRRQGARGLSMPQFRALTYLNREPGSSLSAVADHLGVTSSTASLIADRLVRDGYLERAVNPEERRRITLTLTSTGSRLLQEAREATRACVAKVIDGLSDEQLDVVVSGLTLLSDAFRAAALEKKHCESADRSER